jgi:FkbM family methyltransferase
MNIAAYDFASDPIFGQFRPWIGPVKAGFDVNFVGQLTDVAFNSGWADEHRTKDRAQTWPPYPPLQGETFEWELLLSAIIDARDRFTMIEAGAGYGRWLISAVCAIRLRRPELSFSLMGVEAEPAHFQWMQKHFRDNGVDPADHRLIYGAVDAKDGESTFMFGHDPAEWYGAYIPGPNRLADSVGNNTPHKVPAYSIASLLEPFERVDLIDFDIQGSEEDAIPAWIDAMTRKVKRAFVETHGFNEHAAVHQAFGLRKWKCLHNYNFESEAMTPYGTLKFLGEGVQCWINPHIS